MLTRKPTERSAITLRTSISNEKLDCIPVRQERTHALVTLLHTFIAPIRTYVKVILAGVRNGSPLADPLPVPSFYVERPYRMRDQTQMHQVSLEIMHFEGDSQAATHISSLGPYILSSICSFLDSNTNMRFSNLSKRRSKLQYMLCGK